MEISRLTLSEWDEALPGAGFEVFHTPPALGVLERHVPGELHLFAGFEGEEIVGLFPLYVRSGPLGTALVTSPPPGMNVPYLGPVLFPTSPKQSRYETLNRRFTEGVLDEVGLNARTLLFVASSPDYRDPRPFHWRDLSVDTSFTYHVDVGRESPDELLQSFSRSRRREIRTLRDSALHVELGGLDAARTIFEETKLRYEGQGLPYQLDWTYVEDVITTLDDRARVYGAWADDELHGGLVVLYSNDAAYFWVGGTRATYDGASVNSLLHWQVIHDLAVDAPFPSITRYDMVGAGKRRLSRYKAKFGPTLEPYYVVESAGRRTEVAKGAYGLLNTLRTRLP